MVTYEMRQSVKVTTGILTGKTQQDGMGFFLHLLWLLEQPA